MLSGVFLFSLLFLGTVGIASAATLETENWHITVSETENMRLDFAIEYNGEFEELTEAQALSVTPDVPDTDAETPVETPEDAPLLPGVPGTIVINEFVSDPIEGEHEWVELYNIGLSSVNLEGWKLVEGAGRETSLEGILGASEYLVVEPAGNLNNAGDTIYILDPYDTEIDRVTYGNWEDEDVTDNAPVATDPESVGRDPGGGHHLMTPTQNAENEIIVTEDEPVFTAQSSEEEDSTNTDTEPDVDEPQESEPATEEPEAESAMRIALSNIRSLDPVTEVITEGTVAAAPGILGRQLFYLAGSGIQVYLHSGDFPALSRGMRVQVHGILSSVSGESRIKLSNSQDIQILGSGDAPSPHDISSMMIGESTEGWLVRLTGMITERSTGEFILADTEGEARIFIKPSTGIAITSDVGEDITVTGIVSQTSSGYRILPRDQQDILPRTTEPAEENDTEVIAGITSNSDNNRTVGWLLATFTLLSFILAGMIYYLKKKHPKSRILLTYGS